MLLLLLLLLVLGAGVMGGKGPGMSVSDVYPAVFGTRRAVLRLLIPRVDNDRPLRG